MDETNPSFVRFDAQLGEAVNLIKGYGAPHWNSANNTSTFHPPKVQPMTSQMRKLSQGKGSWSYPVITLHETVEDLVTNLLDYSVDAPGADPAPPSLPSGPLLLSSSTGAAARESLAEKLGLSLDDSLRYVLVKLTRFDEKIVHTVKEHGILQTAHAWRPDPRHMVDEKFTNDSAKLRHSPDVTVDIANEYLDYFDKYGTHFVSSISVGDEIVQVFAYGSKRFAKVKEGFEKNDFSGAKAANFVYYTTDANKGHFGYVKEYGNIICLSNDEAFRESLENDSWKENLFARQYSVFQIFAENTAVSRNWLDKNCVRRTSIGLTLAPITTLLGFKRATMWRRIFKAAMSAVFGDSIDINYSEQEDVNFSEIIPESQPGIVSTIATPKINIFKARLSLSDMQLVAPDEAASFLAYGCVISGTTSEKKAIELPGTKVCLFGYILDMRASKDNGTPNIISVKSEAFDNLELGCDRFLGIARFQSSDGSKHFLVADGLRYDLGIDGWPRPTRDIRQPPKVSHLAHLKDNLEFSLAFGESILGFQTDEDAGNPTKQFARGYLGWLGKLIPQDIEDEKLLEIRFRALDLAKFTPNSGYGAFVPILPPDEYEDSVEKILNYIREIQREIQRNTDQINHRKEMELINTTAKTLNENIIESGNLLAKLIEANAKSAKNLSTYYDSIISANESSLKDQQKKIDALSDSLMDQQTVVSESVEKYRAAVERWETIETVKFGLTIATDLFSAGTTILIPSSSIKVVETLGTTAQHIQKTLNTLNATMKVYSTVSDYVNKVKKAQNSLDGLDGLDYGDVAALNWQELITNMKIAMAGGPDVPEKTLVLEHFNILADRGKTLANARSNLLQIQRDIYTTQRQKQLSENEADRLRKLVDKLNPKNIEDLDKETIDLVGLTSSLDCLHRQILTTLVKTFLHQDQALQYRWLQKPTPITSYNLLDFLSFRARQSQETLNAKELLLKYQVSTTKPISITIKNVLVGKMINGNAYEIIIDPNCKEFRQYVFLRVQSVVAEVRGVKSTNSGKLHVKLVFSENPFSDRDINRGAIVFHTPSRERIYEYDLITGNANFTDQGHSWSKGVNSVTPFGSWMLSLPNTETNRGLIFENGITANIRLTFTLAAIIADVDPSNRISLRTLHSSDVIGATFGAVEALTISAGPEPELELRGSQSDFIRTLYQAKNATNGWDVVFNMELKAINDALRGQYEDLKNNTTYKNTISLESVPSGGTKKIAFIQKFYLEYGYPELQFDANGGSSSVKLTMPIIKGTLTNCTKMRNEKDATEDCDPPISIAGTELIAYINLSKVSGSTSGGEKIIDIKLLMDTGTFSVENIEINTEAAVQLSTQIKAYFEKNKVEYLINRLNLTNIPVLHDMKPNDFLFKVLKTEANVDILQLFIQTGNRKLKNQTLAYLNNVPEPLPMGSETSLIISDELFFSNILPKSLDTSTGWSLKGQFDSKDNRWYCEFADASIKLTNFVYTLEDMRGARGGTVNSEKFTIYKDAVNWDLSTMTLTGWTDGRMQMKCHNKTQTIDILNTSSTYIFGKEIKHPSKIEKNPLISNVSGKVDLDIEGSGREQNIKTLVQGKAQITGHLSGGGMCGMDDLEAIINQNIKRLAAPKLNEKINGTIKFSSISLFAIKNLLFPKENYINFQKAAVPGPMVVLGNFVKK